MATRQIVNFEGGIKKIIPSFKDIEGKIFPTINNWPEEKEQIYDLLKNTNLICQSAVIQQFNEYIIANEFKEKNSVLAPLISYSFDKRNLPVLIFPKFEPIIKDENFYKYSESESLILLGEFAAKHKIPFEQIRQFMREVSNICIEFGLNEEDIIYNLSNIGYNSTFGLRIIDYGLIESVSDKKFELVE